VAHLKDTLASTKGEEKMRKLSAMAPNKSPANQELRRRIALSNRPHLKIGIDRLDSVSVALASSESDRAQFNANPTRYLKGQALPVSSCNFTKPVIYHGAPQTTELVSQGACISLLLDCAVDSDIRALFRALVIGVDGPDLVFASDDVNFNRESTIKGLKQDSTLL
jgi:hypothetical protein